MLGVANIFVGTMKIIYLLLLLILLCGCGNGDECISDEKCYCYNTDEYEFQCPPNNYKLIIHASKNNKYVSIDCYNLTEYDVNIFPTYNAGEKDYFMVRFCPLPKDNFYLTLKALNISRIKTLRIEQNFVSSGSSKIDVSKELFQGLQQLEILYIDLLTTTILEDAFHDLSNLTQLYLERSNISTVGYMFDNNHKLKALHLSRNEIQHLPDGVFKNLSNLKQLHLWGNKFTKITKKYFTGLEKLQSLELSSNNISFVDSDSFSELKNLVNISLRMNKLSHISSDIFQQNKMLESIRIGNNPDLILPDGIFSNLTFLKSVNMESSRLNYIPENIFSGTNNLSQIKMASNNLTTLPENLFQSKVNLTMLDLSNNKIVSLPDKIFSSLEKLEELYLQNNLFTNINEKLLESLINLKYLNFNNNKIRTISLRAFTYQINLIALDLSYNLYNMSYETLGYIIRDLTPLSAMPALEDIKLSHNLVTDFPAGILFSKVHLKNLDLSYNKIDYVEAASLITASKYPVQVDLRHNNISGVEFEEMIAAASQTISKNDALHNNNNASITTADMSFNPFICDCRNFKFVQYMQGKLEPLNIRTMVDIVLDDDNTLCSKPKSFQHIPIAKLDPRKITCKYRGENCPDSCDCFKRSYDNFVVVNCSYKNLTSYPRLNFNNEHIELNLVGNMFTHGPENMTGYENVSNLFLSHNKLQSLMWIPPKIEILWLDGNQLSGINSEVLKVLNKSTVLKNLKLDDNPWICDCSALKFQNFIKAKYDKVQIQDILCTDNDALINKKDLCKSHTPIILTILLPIVGVLLLATVAIAIYLQYKQEIKIWLYAKNLCLWFVTEEELDKDKIYDVFISFSHKDEDFVMQNLLPVLESGPNPYKICIHVRDWPGGEFITTQVTNSVMNSRRTLVVLSNSFLESVWGKLEFRTAHTRAIEEGRARVIVVKYGDLDEDKLDEDLKAYLKTNTYVEWGKPWFWNKLKYALPHSRQPNFYHANQKHANIVLKIDDKFELTSQPVIHPESTPPVIALDSTLLKSHPLNFNNTNCHTPPAEAPLISR